MSALNAELCVFNLMRGFIVQWQKIETAPIEDVVLVYIPHSAGGYVTGGVLLKSGDWVNNTDIEFIKPTHWMPLPEPPNDA